ncbi:zinc finger protein 638-like isoform X2 [Notolabrus celidotus]|uniref:zinc finger protein 638-like isoform X2 n=1 Tax=Notolabrus celidotus TaxID=1203425 RepID=UPI00148FCDAB|nr:zinc finger protein 638-like isoform X2 [Notolabrus celidotus]
MYHHHSQQQGSQSFSNGPRPPHHQPPPNQHQNRSSDMLSQAMGFQFPRPTQLPDELESALAIRGARDMDHRLIDHMNRPNQHQNQSSAPGISQHGSFGSNPMALNSENPSAHQQGVDWSSYQPPTKLFSSPPPGGSHQSQRHPGPQQQPQSSHAGARIQSWKTGDLQSPSQARHPLGSGDNQGMYTPESAGSILASFGLSNEDLEVLSHYPDDQLTPDTLPFILRDIQINKTGTQNTAAPSPSFTSGVQEMPVHPSRSSHSPEVPSLLTVTQTAGKVIDYGHASRAKEETGNRKTFKREQLSTERTVKMYPTPLQSSSAPKPVKAERRQVRLEPTEPSKHGDQDYRRTSSDHRKSNRSPGREFPPSSKPRNLDRDYRREAPKPRPSSETRSDASSRRSLSSPSGSKPHSSSSKKLPTPTMISDFSAVSPKVYPHTCSLCHTQCDQEKDWVDHINTVNHTAACRDLRNKYPDWKPNPPSGSGRHGSRGSWDPKDHSPSQSVSRSVSCSLSPSPPHSKHRVGPPHHRLHGRPYTPHHHPRHQRYPSDPSRSGLKRPHDDSTKFSTDASRHPPSSRTGHGSKHGPSQSSTKAIKSGTKPGVKTTKTASGKAADSSVKPPPAKKKKKVVTPAAQDSSVADRLVYLTGIPKDASEQEVTDLVGSFGKINNVILMPCSEEESEKGEGQKASVCMVKAEDAQALANSTKLSIREQQITTSTAKTQKSEEGKSSDDDKNGKSAPEADKGAAREDTAAGAEADQKTSEEKGMLLITGLPESGWSESDIVKLVQPFGTPFDIVMATQIGKVLLSVLDMEAVQEMVKVHSFKPAKIGDAELKMIHIKQSIGLSTPVALYNLLMAPEAPLESPPPVGWSSLLVISNVPSTPSGPSEVQKLVRRFGTVIKTLVLNSMVICEMATAAMALSVYKRFQTFPCIIQNNPLFFSRKADPRANTQTKVITAYLDPTEETPATGKGSKTSATAEEEEIAAKEDSGSPSEVMEKDVNMKEEEIVIGDEALEENKSQDENEEVKKEEVTVNISEPLAAPDIKPEADSETNEMEIAEEKKDVDVSPNGNDKSAAGEETKTSISDDKAASKETPVPELPQASVEMVITPQEECQTSTTTNSNNTTGTPTDGKQEETQPQKEQGGKLVLEPKELTENQAEEETKKQERELKEREARKEKERKEKEKKERERRAWESKERVRKERERDERARRERERREEERRERERRERKRTHGEGSTGWRSSSRSEGYKRSSERDVQTKRSEVASKTVEDEECDDFPFNLSDFVTVDEVGDVTDLPDSPSPAAPMEMTEGEEDAPSLVQKDDSEGTPAEVTTEAGIPDATVTPVKSEEIKPEGETGNKAASCTPDELPDSSHSQTPVPTGQPEAPETETKLTTALDSTTEVDRLPMPADSSSNSRETCVVTAESVGEEKENDALNNNQVKEEKEREDLVVLDKTEEKEKMQDEEDDKTQAPAADIGTKQRSEDETNTEEESATKKLKTETPTITDDSLPPFDPSNPVGMEFLVPKTGFFCKVCNRFFSGSKEAEISHCKSLKHYENLQKFLQTTKMADETAKPVSS